MNTANLTEAYAEFWDEAKRQAVAEDEFLLDVFFDMYKEIARVSGHLEDLEAASYKNKRFRVRIDGYYYDEDTGKLTISISDFNYDETLGKLHTKDIAKLFKLAENFVERSYDPDFSSQLEETSNGYKVASLILTEGEQIARVHFIIFSTAQLASRLRALPSKKFLGRTYSYEIFDFVQYSNILSSRTERSPITVNFEELKYKPIPYLQASSGADGWKSYLLSIPGELLAELYAMYDSRLLEQNVRTFLQARGKVNKGIINTLKSNPERFFSYNNGLTATADEVDDFKLTESGQRCISSITGLQIVNGGQTTASILYARDKERADISKVYVQMKLTVIPDENLEDAISSIARFANTQNKVSAADFFSNHPFHLQIERFSSRISFSPEAESLHTTKWFYERVRGQYKNKQLYMKEGEKKRFSIEFPRHKMMTKTDLAKYYITFECFPHVVSFGAQKNFMYFAKIIDRIWTHNKSDIHEKWYKDAVAMAIIFKDLDFRVMRAMREGVYESGYKANIVTYTISWIMHYITVTRSSGFDYSKIWRQQAVPSQLQHAFDIVAPQIQKSLVAGDKDVRNVTEWCKKEACWSRVKELNISLSPKLLEHVMITKLEELEQAKEAKYTQRIDNPIQDEIRLIAIGMEWNDIRIFANTNDIITAGQENSIARLLANKPLNKKHIKILLELLEQVQSIGYAMHNTNTI